MRYFDTSSQTIILKDLLDSLPKDVNPNDLVIRHDDQGLCIEKATDEDRKWWRLEQEIDKENLKERLEENFDDT